MDGKKLVLLACLVIAGAALAAIPVADAKREASWVDTRDGAFLQGTAHWSVGNIDGHERLKLRKLHEDEEEGGGEDKDDNNDEDDRHRKLMGRRSFHLLDEDDNGTDMVFMDYDDDPGYDYDYLG